MNLEQYIPREHGAWAMWIVPMLSAVLVTHFSLSFLLLFLCFALLYVAHHPIVMLAKRGGNVRTGEKKFVVVVAVPALVIGTALIVIYNLPWLALFGMLELALFIFSVKAFVGKEQRTFTNELTIVAALTLSAPASYYTITHVVDGKAVMLYILNFLFFGSSVFYVKMIIEFLRTKGFWRGEAEKARSMTIAYHAALVAVILLMSIMKSVNNLVLLGFLPMLVQVAVGVFSKNTRVNFTQLGIALIVQSVVFLTAVGFFWK